MKNLLKSNWKELTISLFAIILVGVIGYSLGLNDELKESNLEKERIMEESESKTKEIKAIQNNLQNLEEELDKTSKSNAELEKSIKEKEEKLNERGKVLENKDSEIKTLKDKNSKLQKDLQAKLDKKEKESKVLANKNNNTKANNTVSNKTDNAVAVASTPSRNNQPTNSKKIYTMEATAYTPYCTGCSGISAAGINLRSNPNLKLVAVDPRVIPLGTKVYVEGYGYAVAGDTGGAIKGMKIDLLMQTKNQAYSFGRRNVTVHVLN